ncbi:MAG: hypothetical protein K2N56_10795 [Oscillospiraceae bacterium]|nr:hypothetical protein [Oscillospiraceae bacterium]
MSDYNHNGKKFPYFIGIGMIVFGILLMILSGQLDESARSPLIYGGVLVFVGGFASTVIYSTRKQSELDENGEKKTKSRAEKTMWAFGVVCLVGLLTLLAGFILFGGINMPVVLIGMALFLIGGFVMISIFSKHAAEFLNNDDNDNNDKKSE